MVNIATCKLIKINYCAQAKKIGPRGADYRIKITVSVQASRGEQTLCAEINDLLKLVTDAEPQRQRIELDSLRLAGRIVGRGFQ